MPVDERELLVRRLFAIQQVSNTLVGQSDEVLRAMFDEIVAAIVKLDPTAVAPRYQQGRLDALAKRVREIVGPTYDDLYWEQRALLASVGAREAQATTASLRAVLGAGAAGKVAPTTGLGQNFFKALVDTQPMQGALLSDWFKDQSRKTVFNVDRQIRLGMLNGDSVGDLVRRVRGRSAGKRGQYVGGVMQTSTRDAESIVRTAVNDIGNTARMNTFAANADIVATTTFVATLDSRTSPECQAADGKRWKLDDPDIQRPPLHIRCRSTLVPDIDWESLGLEPPPEGTRASADGQVAASTTYEQWLKGQPKAVQDEILGPGRAELFRQDRVTLKQLVTTDGRRVPLEELRGAGVPEWDTSKPLPAFSSIAEAEKFMESRHPGIAWEFSGAHMDAVNPTLRALDRELQEWPEVAGRLRYVGTGHGGKFTESPDAFWKDKEQAYAWAARNGRVIALNPKYFSDPDAFAASLKRDAEPKLIGKKKRPVSWHPEGVDSIESVAVHEFGHMVDNFLRVDGRFIHPGASDLGGALQVNTTWERLVRNIRVDGSLSEYAASRKDRDTKEREMVAEAYAAWRLLPAGHRLQKHRMVSQLAAFFDEVKLRSTFASTPSAWGKREAGAEEWAAFTSEWDRIYRRLGLNPDHYGFHR